MVIARSFEQSMIFCVSTPGAAAGEGSCQVLRLLWDVGGWQCSLGFYGPYRWRGSTASGAQLKPGVAL